MQPGVAPLPHSGRRFSVSTREASSAHGGGRAATRHPGSGSFLQRSDTLLSTGCAPPSPLTKSPTGPGFARPGLGTGSETTRCNHGPAALAPGPTRRRSAARGRARGPAPALTVRPVPSTITSYSSFMAGQASAAAWRKEKAQAPSGHPADAESAQAGPGARGEGEVGRSGGAARASTDGGRHLRREAKSGAGARRRAATRASAAGAGLRRRSGGRPSRPPARSLATSPSPAQPFAFPSPREKRAARPSPRFRFPVRSAAGGRRGRARALEGWGEASWRPESGPPPGPLLPPPRPRGALGLRARTGHVGRNPPRRAWAGAGAENAGGRRGPGPPPGVT